MNEDSDPFASVTIDGVPLAEDLDSLRDGGPDVDEVALLDYIADVLTEESRHYVAVQISTWKPWYLAYLETQAEIARGAEWCADGSPRTETASRSESKEANADRRGSWVRWTIAGGTVLLIILVSRLFIPSVDVEMVIGQLNGNELVVSRMSDGSVTGLEHIPSTWQDEVRHVLESRSLADLIELPNGLVPKMRGQQDTYVAPVGTVVFDTSPRFQWNEIPDADAYEVWLYRDGEQVVPSPIEAGDQLMITWPESLIRGVEYQWEIKVIKSDQEFRLDVIHPRFKILEFSAHEEINELRRQYDQFPLIMAMTYLRYGLLDLAIGEIKRLEEANPNSEFVRKLRDSVQMQR